MELAFARDELLETLPIKRFRGGGGVSSSSAFLARSTAIEKFYADYPRVIYTCRYRQMMWISTTTPTNRSPRAHTSTYASEIFIKLQNFASNAISAPPPPCSFIMFRFREYIAGLGGGLRCCSSKSETERKSDIKEEEPAQRESSIALNKNL